MKNFRQQRRPKKSSLIIGRDAVIANIKSGRQLDRIYLQNNLQGKWIGEIKLLASQYHIPINRVPVEKINGFNVTDHDGIVAQVAKVQYYELQQIISFARTAYCCGANAIIIPDKGVGALNEDAIVTSAGALEKIPVCRVKSLMKAVDELHLNGINVFASEMTAKKNIFDCEFKEPCAIVMGSEEKGIYPALMKLCDEKFKIPMSGDFESLNVSVATGMILYEVMKQRMEG